MSEQFNFSDIIEVTTLKDYQLHIKFADGAEGIVDIAKLVPFEGIFEPLKDKTYFDRVTINKDIGTICWENGADISPALLYKSIRNK